MNRHLSAWPAGMRPDGRPSNGDVIICPMDPTSQVHALRVMPKPLQLTYPTYAEALTCATNFAAMDRVDVWLEPRESDFVLIERNRRPGSWNDHTDRGPKHEDRLDSSIR